MVSSVDDSCPGLTGTHTMFLSVYKEWRLNKVD